MLLSVIYLFKELWEPKRNDKLMCMAIKEEKKNWENTKPSYHTPNPTNELGTQWGLYSYKGFTF